MPISPRAGSRSAARQRKSWSSSSVLGALNGCTSQPCGLMPLITCLITPSLPAVSIALQHDQHRPPVLRVQPLLQVAQAVDVLGHHRLGAALVEVEPRGIGRIEFGEPETVGIVDPEAFEGFFNLHRSQLQTCSRKALTYGGIFGSRSAGAAAMRISESSGSLVCAK